MKVRHQRSDVRSQRKGFTLLELLIVIGIMGLMLAVGIPAFESFSKRSMNSASPALMSTLRLARQHAITHRRYVWVVFPDAGSGNGQGGVLNYNDEEVELALRSFAVIEGDINNQPDEYITEWKYLPQGIYFDDKLTKSNSVFKSYDSGGTTAYYPFPNSTSSDQNMPAIQFRPNGRAYFRFNSSGWRSSSTAQIYLMAAVVNVDTGSGVLVSAPIPISTNNAEVRVFAQTGQLDYSEMSQ
jgi:prepilin-type N-terminal cleavage/methylation domain-containing protein